MKKVLLILSALLIITGCKVTSTSSYTPEEDDEYSDGIYLFYVKIGADSINKIKVDYIYEDNSSEVTESFYTDFEQTQNSEIIKIDRDNIRFLSLSWKTKDREDFVKGYMTHFDKTSFTNIKNGLYAVEFFFNFNSLTNLRKTKSIEYYLNNVDFYEDKNILFVKNTNQSEKRIVYSEGVRNTFADYTIKPNEIRKYIYHYPINEYVSKDRKRIKIDNYRAYTKDTFEFPYCINLLTLGKGYYYTELKDGQFTTPVKLNSYKDILEN